MIWAVLAAVLAADGGTGLPDGGEYVVLDVNHAVLWTNLPDGGVSDAMGVVGGAWLDNDALMHAGQGAAFGRAALAVPPDVDTRTILLVAGLMLVIGAALGFVGGFTAGKL